MSWTYIAATGPRPIIIDGIAVEKEKWIDTGKTIHIKDPRYGQEYEFVIWEVFTSLKKIRFAAGEFSNGIWGFYKEEQ